MDVTLRRPEAGLAAGDMTGFGNGFETGAPGLQGGYADCWAGLAKNVAPHLA